MSGSFKLLIVAVALAAAGGGAYLFVRSQARATPDTQALLQKAASAKPVERAPNFALPGVDGHRHPLSQWRGQVRLLNFWATWCGPCRKEVPALVKLQNSLGGRGFQIIGIATDEPNQKVVKQFADAFNIKYPLLMDDGHAANIARHLGFSLIGLPASVLIDGQANIISIHLGPIDARRMRGRVRKLLNGRKSR